MNPLLPRTVDNTYRGFRIALWLFAGLLLMKTAMGVNSIINGHAVASSADGIPLDTFTPAGAQTVVTMFALSGLRQLTICLVGIVVLVRYRALVPFMFVLFLLEHAGRQLILRAMPIVRVGAPPASMIHLILLALMIAGLALSLLRRDRRPAGIPA